MKDQMRMEPKVTLPVRSTASFEVERGPDSCKLIIRDSFHSVIEIEVDDDIVAHRIWKTAEELSLATSKMNRIKYKRQKKETEEFIEEEKTKVKRGPKKLKSKR